MSNPPFRILRRPSTVNDQINDQLNSALHIKTFEQREADYAAARRRIMGSEVSDETTSTTLKTSCMESNENVSATQQPTEDHSNVKTSVSSKSSQTAIPLMSIPTGALPFSSVDQAAFSTMTGTSKASMLSRHNLQGHFGSVLPVQSQHKLPAFCSALPVTKAVESSLPGLHVSQNFLPQVTNICGSFTNQQSPLSLQNLDVMRLAHSQTSADHHTKFETALDANSFLNQLNFMCHYQRAMSNTHFSSQPFLLMAPFIIPTVYQNEFMRNKSEAAQTALNLLHHQTATSRFTYSSG